MGGSVQITLLLLENLSRSLYIDFLRDWDKQQRPGPNCGGPAEWAEWAELEELVCFFEKYVTPLTLDNVMMIQWLAFLYWFTVKDRQNGLPFDTNGPRRLGWKTLNLVRLVILLNHLHVNP